MSTKRRTLLATAPKVERPTMMVFDLDPGEPAGVLDCAQVALWLKEVLEGLGEGFGGAETKGVHAGAA